MDLKLTVLAQNIYLSSVQQCSYVNDRNKNVTKNKKAADEHPKHFYTS